LAVIFRQRWEGFQILAKHLKAADLAIATQERGEGRAPCAGHRRCSWARGGLGTGPGTGGIHQLIRQLRLRPWPRTLPAALAHRAFAGAWNRASRDPPGGRGYCPRMGIRTAISNASLCGALATAGRGRSGKQLLSPTQRQFTSWALWAAVAAVNALPGLRRFRR
jgi:hypothetical protein